MIYLDYQATTPLAPEAREAMLPWLGTDSGFANPHSAHKLGRQAAAAVEHARAQITAPFGDGGRLLFTSGATEAANWAIKGIMADALPERRKLVTIATEHACVLDSARWLERMGCELVVLPVDAGGLVDLDAAAAAIDARTTLVAAMLVNNEIGVIQPIGALGALARAVGAVMFCDAVQGYGRVPLPTAACDLIAISAHKIHGPKGVGALWLRDGIAPAPLLHGGAQEGGLRSGTLSPALCAGFGAAAALADAQRATDRRHVAALAAQARAAFGPEWALNGDATARYLGNLNLRRDGLDAGRLISEVREVAFSAGSACASGSGRPSHVLRAIGLDDRAARGSIRLGFGRYTTAEEVADAAALLNAAAARQMEWA
ncbi:cysteine desulfurase family protein [Sphingomonas nostoxanthinifaciens]|uniref:cysteine desulfurase family protein n=1 Tax=Sphingomonas nostoxanthinifaciens TaxID=2872652 RepID=UPI001CC21678|nr:cysteine desulfurase family protein [Sphingomonas nostoxanthinifaciens]UAK25151.1 cysteine desulfurase [Sphingomonas nostoxanthinifaciens]